MLRVSVANVKKGEYKKMGEVLGERVTLSTSRSHVQGREVFVAAFGRSEQHSVLERVVSE